MHRQLFAALVLCSPAAVRAERDLQSVAHNVQVLAHRDAVVETNEGEHVCCLEGIGADFRVSVYHAGRAQKDVKKCLLTSVADGCADETQCTNQCSTSMKGNRRYYDLITDAETKKLEDAKADKDKAFSKADKAQQDSLSAASKSFDAAVKGPRKDADGAAKVMAQRKERLDAAQAAFQKAQAEFDAAQADSKAKDAAKQAAEQQATAAKTKAESDAQSKAASDKQAAEGVVAQRTKAVDDATKEAAKYQTAAVPAACQDSKSGTGAQDCCCSINKRAVRVSGDDFIDWGKCKGAEAYSKTSGLSLPCGFLTQCNKCADLICGKGMCP